MDTNVRRSQKEHLRTDPSTGFDVLCIVGRVEFDTNGTETPYVAAMRCIAEHEAEGAYTFPHGDGRTCTVTVEYVDA